VFGVPQAKKIVVKLAKSKELIISLTSNKQNVSVFEVQLNGKKTLDHSVAYSTLTKGGKLEFISEN
jgi:putative alpha-1,2-mannosidase